VAFFRATMPALAGTAGMRYPKFLAFNAAGGLTWGTAVVLLGYLAGNSYATIEKTFGRATALIVLTVAVLAAVAWRVRRRSPGRTSRRQPDPDSRPPRRLPTRQPPDPNRSRRHHPHSRQPGLPRRGRLAPPPQPAPLTNPGTRIPAVFGGSALIYTLMYRLIP